MKVRSEIAGVVMALPRGVGERVVKGEAVLMLECMKMEIPVQAPGEGTIRSIEVQVGQPVEEGQVVVVLEP